MLLITECSGEDSMPGDTKKTKEFSPVSHLNTSWEQILHMGTRRRFSTGESICLYSEKPFFYYIVSGLVRLSYICPNGRERTMLLAGPGSVMNVPTILGADHGNTLAQAMADTEIVLFSAALLSDPAFISAHPKQIISLLRSLCTHLVIHTKRLGESTHRDNIRQVCAMLYAMSQKPEGTLRNTQRSMALQLGIHITTLTRILHRLRKEGIIGQFTKNSLVVTDMPRLKAIAEGKQKF